MSIHDTLDEREKTYGNYADNCKLTQDMKDIVHAHPRWVTMSPDKKQSVEMILYKIARIITGDHGHKDSWHDIGGFALLIEQDLK
jgi:hypothetical protein